MRDVGVAIKARRCPFCRSKAHWLEGHNDNDNTAGMAPPDRGIGCVNANCRVKPHTAFKCTQDWQQGVGYFPVNHDAEHRKEWNAR